ncbi:DUF3794 domain-containing protein [Romboutsia sp.]|uniref:DUF3794 domain-containing protein n=1 Tax=Romboutsia sp. TaxID=1965302 RepID=UPI003F33C717
MGKLIRNLIEYNGIESCSYGNLEHFTQMNTDYQFCIPSQKPDIEQIVRVWVKGDIEHYEVIKTPIGISFEGQESTGFKLLIAGSLDLKIEYVACGCAQSIHTAHTKFPFCGHVVLPKNFNTSSILFPNISIEDIFSEKIDPRCIYNNVTLLLIADIC